MAARSVSAECSPIVVENKARFIIVFVVIDVFNVASGFIVDVVEVVTVAFDVDGGVVLIIKQCLLVEVKRICAQRRGRRYRLLLLLLLLLLWKVFELWWQMKQCFLTQTLIQNVLFLVLYN